MNNYFANLEAIARGKGSPQARDEGCLICEEEEEADWEGYWRRRKE